MSGIQFPHQAPSLTHGQGRFGFETLDVNSVPTEDTSATRVTAPAGSLYAMRMTSHAEVRLRQRGIRTDVLDCLLAYGRREHDHADCEILYFDTRAIERVQRQEGPQLAHLVSDHRDVYAVVDSDGCIVTAGHRFRRILRDKSLSNFRPGRSRRSPRPRRRGLPITVDININTGSNGVLI